MTTTINASTSAGLVQTADTSGVLALQTANTTALTISSAQIVNFANTPTVAGSPIGATPGGSTTQLQYNNASAFGGISGVTTDGTRITASTTIGVGGATPSTSGSGITFPASQSASSDANTLDDYEEGTWTPTDGSGAGLSFTNVYANYTKIGRFAFFEFQVTYPSTASGADTRINGFPFNNIDDYEGKPGVCLVAGQGSGFITQKQGSNYGFIVNASNSNITNNQASTRTARGAQHYETT
jgi:hypothetical protein